MAKAKVQPDDFVDAVTVDPPAATPVVTKSAPTKYKVSLKYQPETVVEATCEADAIAAYNAANGITQTDHQHSVAPVE